MITNFYQNNFINRLVPEFIIYRYAKPKSKRLLLSNYEHIDEEKFFAKDLIHLPNLSKKIENSID